MSENESKNPSDRPANEPSRDPSSLDASGSPEERVAAAIAAEADALNQVLNEMAGLKASHAELADQFLRAKAETENARRRADEEVSKARKFAVDSFAQSMLPVLDSLEAGLLLEDASTQQLREGATATLRLLKNALERNMVLEINPALGSRFDPHQHQAISAVQVPAGSTQEANTIVTVLQKGYSIAERVMRPALVTVTAPER